jgi:carboxyl-terminal processing protease
MIDGMIQSLDDPYTEFVPPSDEAQFNKEIRGTYVGIGAEVQLVDDYLTIISPMAASPALEVGLLAGDTVLEIEGQSTFKVPVEDCVRLLMGAPGTTVRFRVRHADGVEQDLTLTRRQIVTQTVRGLRRSGEGWNYCVDAHAGIYGVRITQFNDTTARELLAALNEIGVHRINGLLLDVRDNPGGSLAAAIEVADLFLQSGLIVSIKDRRGERDSWSARPSDPLPEFPMLVLVNQQSASASEILAGALQANGRAKVLGMRSFGKGSVQEVRELSDHHGTLKMTVAYYCLAGGRAIHRRKDSDIWGIEPDPGFVVRVSDEDYRAKLLASREHDIIRRDLAAAAESPCAGPDWIREHLRDVQLARAAEAMLGRLVTGQWPVVGEQDAGVLAAIHERERLSAARSRMLAQLSEVESRLARLNQVAGEPTPPLLPADADLIAGTLTLRDRNDQVIGAFRIDGGDLEAALRQVELSRISPATDQRTEPE